MAKSDKWQQFNNLEQFIFEPNYNSLQTMSVTTNSREKKTVCATKVNLNWQQPAAQFVTYSLTHKELVDMYTHYSRVVQKAFALGVGKKV